MTRVRTLMVIAVASCAGPLVGVRDSDRAAWRGVPLIHLEKHPVFSTLPQQKRSLSDGSELWDFPNCQNVKEGVTCSSYEGFSGPVTNCVGGRVYETCCHNQFIVRDGTVEEYRPSGNCWTDCSLRPEGQCR